jgi:catechol 2,3-dioxygenase-like lactoylglutathione lyase family enzyme
MRIHHFTVPARNPERVAAVLAELLGARVIPLPHPVGTLLVYAGDSDGTAIEVWPAGMRGRIGAAELHVTDLPLPEDWPHHGYVTTDATSADQVLASFAREGWRAERVHNGSPGGGFSLVRGWIENHTGIEIADSHMRAEYERFFAQVVSRPPASANDHRNSEGALR